MPLQIIRQDITKMRVDAIVNTTNEQMIGYSGVDRAVHLAAGPKLEKACTKLVPLGLGTAKITRGYNLPAKYIIHTSGPVWNGGFSGESILLRSCYIESLKLAVENRCESVAFPLISSGAYGYPKEQVLRFAIQVITEFLYEHELTVYLCVYDRTSYAFSRQLFDEIQTFIADEVVRCEDEASYDTLAMPRFEPSGRKQAPRSRHFAASMPSALMPMEQQKAASAQDLKDYIAQMEKTFGYKLFEWIDARGMTDVECYKKANIDKKTFSKIKCNPQTYKPSKQTAVAFAIALRLNLEETQELLAAAGLTLSGSFVFDKIIRYFIQKEIYDIFVINEALFEFDQMLLGC